MQSVSMSLKSMSYVRFMDGYPPAYNWEGDRCIPRSPSYGRHCRIVVQWLAWQYQQYKKASGRDAWLTVHLADQDSSTAALHHQLFKFLHVTLPEAELHKVS